jgi:galactofuranosylgalactofuranosylrhamnosyl-N-acetylglucosaminyl-diphospho-decaprenol beta-1,5/1,6-galactofuranosyltransferase
MQYSTVELMLMAVEDVLGGPEGLHGSMTTKMAELRALRAGFPDAKAEPDLDEFPAVKRRNPPKKGREPAAPEGRRAMVRTALAGAVRQLRPVDAFSREHPEVTVPHVDQTWWLLSRFDSALVSSADGTKAAWYQRDPRRFRTLVRRNMALHARLAREWPELSRRYRDAIPELASTDRWRETFEAARREEP